MVNDNEKSYCLQQSQMQKITAKARLTRLKHFKSRYSSVQGDAVSFLEYNGFVYFGLFSKNEVFNSNVYCQQIIKLSKAINKKQTELTNSKEVVFHYANVRLYTFHHSLKITVVELGSDAYLPNSTELTPSDLLFTLFS